MNNGQNMPNFGANAPAPPAQWRNGSGSTAPNMQMLPYRFTNPTQVRPNWPPEVWNVPIPRPFTMPFGHLQNSLPRLPQNLPDISPQLFKWMADNGNSLHPIQGPRLSGGGQLMRPQQADNGNSLGWIQGPRLSGGGQLVRPQQWERNTQQYQGRFGGGQLVRFPQRWEKNIREVQALSGQLVQQQQQWDQKYQRPIGYEQSLRPQQQWENTIRKVQDLRDSGQLVQPQQLERNTQEHQRPIPIELLLKYPQQWENTIREVEALRNSGQLVRPDQLVNNTQGLQGPSGGNQLVRHDPSISGVKPKQLGREIAWTDANNSSSNHNIQWESTTDMQVESRPNYERAHYNRGFNWDTMLPSFDAGHSESVIDSKALTLMSVINMDNVFARLAPVYALSSRGRDVTLSHWKFREMYIRHLKMQDSWSEAEKIDRGRQLDLMRLFHHRMIEKWFFAEKRVMNSLEDLRDEARKLLVLEEQREKETPVPGVTYSDAVACQIVDDQANPIKPLAWPSEPAYETETERTARHALITANLDLLRATFAHKPPGASILGPTLHAFEAIQADKVRQWRHKRTAFVHKFDAFTTAGLEFHAETRDIDWSDMVRILRGQATPHAMMLLDTFVSGDGPLVQEFKREYKNWHIAFTLLVKEFKEFQRQMKAKTLEKMAEES